MIGDRRSLVSLGALALLSACGGGRETGAPATASRDTSAAVSDTAALPQAQPDTVSASRDTATSVARTPAAKPAPEAAPAPKPVAPKKPAPATRPAPPSDTVTAPAAPADTARPVTTPTDTTVSASNAGPHDPYHQAPRDTVGAEVYDGWKQYNLNCARCHGEDVLGTTIAPHLIVSVRPDGAVPTKEAFVQTVCAGRPEKGMPSWCALGMEMDKINAMYSYVKGRSDGTIGPGRPARRE
jgi:Cytochrome C oxidase, cbb3-type, subunit III